MQDNLRRQEERSSKAKTKKFNEFQDKLLEESRIVINDYGEEMKILKCNIKF